eukprot:4573404-Amphidinium_carterae.1
MVPLAWGTCTGAQCTWRLYHFHLSPLAFQTTEKRFFVVRSTLEPRSDSPRRVAPFSEHSQALLGLFDVAAYLNSRCNSPTSLMKV